MNRVEKYIRIDDEQPSKTGKTKVWRVFNFYKNQVCGYIQWYGGFRRYCFLPLNDFIFDNDFLRLVADFCEARTRDHYGRRDASA